MDETLAIDMFKHFSEDLDPKIKKIMKTHYYNTYYSVVVSNLWAEKRPMFYKRKDVYKYSFKELYEQMCDIFYRFDEGDATALLDIFRLKNFVNYKMGKCLKKGGK